MLSVEERYMKDFRIAIIVSLALFLLAPAFLINTVQAQDVFGDGFESGNFSAWSGTTGSPSIVGTPVHHGDYAAAFNADLEYCYKTFVDHTTIFVRFYFRCSTLPPDQWNTWFFGYILGNNQYIWGIGIQNTGGGNMQIKFERYYPRVNSFYSYPFLANTWYCFEVKFVKGVSDGEYRVWLDGSEVIAVTGLNTSGAPDPDELWVGETTATWRPVTMFIDCVVVDSNYIGPETETSPPVYSDVGTNSTEGGKPCLFHTKWTDYNGLSGYIFGTNNTGTWLNDTWTPLSGLSDWSNVTKVLSSTIGAQVQYQFYCNDTSNNWGSTPMQSLIVTQPEIWYDTALSVSVSSSVALVGYRMSILGDLTYQHNSTGISKVSVRLFYSVTEGEGWNVIATTTTASDGSFYVTWFTTHTGKYIIRAVYGGDEDSNVLGTETLVNVVITDIDEQVFFVSSNSTVSGLVFNSTAKEITFTVSGPENTKGYANIILSKELVPDLSSLRIFFDEIEKPYEVVSVDDLWFVHLSYNHSSHTLRILLPSASSTHIFTEVAPKLALVAVTFVVAVAISLALFGKKDIGK